MSEIEWLWKLQGIDQEINKIKRFVQKNSLESVSLQLQKDLMKLDEFARQLEEECLGKKKSLRAAELDLHGSAAEQKQLEKELYGGTVTQAKELERLQEKLDKLKILVGQKEELIMEMMEEIEEKEVIYQEKKMDWEKKKIETEEHEKKRKVLAVKIKKRLIVLNKDREEIINLLSKSMLDRYEKIQKKFSLQGIALLRGQVCQGCFMALPTGLIQTVSLQRGLHTCDNCGRILYPVCAEE